MRRALIALMLVAAFAGRAAAITPKDLNPEELKKYNVIKANPAAVESFLATRDYARKAAAIAESKDKKLALELKRPKNFDAKYLLAGDVDKINAAIDIGLDALAESMVA